jgi:hypothetical protein
MDAQETLLFIQGYQNRIDDNREVYAFFVSALMNNSRSKKDRKVQPTDLFDRKKMERKRLEEDEETVETKRHRVQTKAKHLPIPKRLQERINKVKAEKELEEQQEDHQDY